MNFSKTFAFASLLTLVAAGNANAGYLSIDEFNGPSSTLQASSGALVAAAIDQAAMGVIGGFRDVTLQHISGGSFSNAIVDSGFFVHQQGGAANTAQTTVRYDGQAGAGLNMNWAGKSGIEVGVIESDFGMAWQFLLIDGSGRKASTVELTPQVSFDGTTHKYYTSFSTFVMEAGFDFTEIDVFQLIANFDSDGPGGSAFPRASLDVTLDYIRLIPEPATLALLGAGLLGLGLVRRRKAA